MPTTLPRYQITETAEVAHAIDLAAQRWPEESRSHLLRRLIDLGSQALENENDAAAHERRAAVAASSGKYADIFGADHLTELRKDWAE